MVIIIIIIITRHLVWTAQGENVTIIWGAANL